MNVITKVNCGSDHRMIRAKVVVDFKQERRKLFRKPFRIRQIHPKDIVEYQDHVTEALKSWTITADINQLNEKLTATIITAASNTEKNNKTNHSKKFGASNIKMMEERRAFKTKTNLQKVQLAELNKTIAKKQREDVRTFNMSVVEDAIVAGRSYKRARRNTSASQNQISSLKEEDGSTTTNRDRIIARTKEFYQQLYATRQ